MIMQLGDWMLDVDVPLTMLLSAKNASERCTCGYCRNYYASIERTCPDLRPFLQQFGLCINGPDELSPFEPTIYEATYIVQGSILRQGQDMFHINGIPVFVQNEEEADMDTEHPAPYFTIRIGLIELPWVLDEPASQVVSPANEPEYMERMEKKLLSRLSCDPVIS